MSVAELRAALEALERDEPRRAHELLGVAEWDAFQRRRRRLAGELGYCRWRLVGGDIAGARAILIALVDGGGR